MKKPVIVVLCCLLALGTATAAFAEEPTPTPAPKLVELSPEDSAPQFYPDSMSKRTVKRPRSFFTFMFYHAPVTVQR